VATFAIGTPFGQSWQRIMGCGDIVPGDTPSYQVCKDIYISHPLGGKMAESPIRLAQSQDREITVPGGPEEDLVRAFEDKWRDIEASRNLLNLATLSRVYGLASLALGDVGGNSATKLDYANLYKKKIFFNALDPLNTSGLIVDQNPNSPTFQKHGALSVAGQKWHPSRTFTLLNENPVYLAWTSSAYAYAGRSCFQRALYPLRSFLETMRADDMVARKCGVIVTKMKAPGSIIDQAVRGLFGIRRNVVKEAETDNVISIGTDEGIESLNLQNLDAPLNLVRNDIIKNCATADDMPAKILSNEAFIEGFGEGTEDAKAVAQYIDRKRIELGPAYAWMDNIVQHLAWSPEFYEIIQAKYPKDYGQVPYETALYRWKNAFTATWPNLIKEPESELVNVDDVKLKALVAIWQVFSPELDPGNKTRLARTIYEGFNARENLFEGTKFELDDVALEDWLEEQVQQQQDQIKAAQEAEGAHPPPVFSGHDSDPATRSAAIASLAEWMAAKPLTKTRATR